jgi:hypothetical protein
MGRREDDDFESDDRRSDEDRPRKRQFSGVTKFFDNRAKTLIIVEYSPDSQEEFDLLADTVAQQTGSPTLDRIVQLCQEVGVRARVLKAGQYVGHIFADGSLDREVQRLL